VDSTEKDVLSSRPPSRTRPVLDVAPALIFLLSHRKLSKWAVAPQGLFRGLSIDTLFRWRVGSGKFILLKKQPCLFMSQMYRRYFNGCDGAGADCELPLTRNAYACSTEIQRLSIGTNANCPTAFRNPDDTFVQVACQANNVSLYQWYPEWPFIHVRLGKPCHYFLWLTRLVWLLGLHTIILNETICTLIVEYQCLFPLNFYFG